MGMNSRTRSRTRAEKVYYVCTHKIRIGCDATAVVQGDKIAEKYGQHNHDTNLVQKRVREEEDKAINAASTNHTWHDFKNLVAQFESMATNLFMD